VERNFRRDKNCYPCQESNTGRPECLTVKNTPWPESASELYQPSDRRLSTKPVPTLEERGRRVVSVTDPYGRILGYLDQCLTDTGQNYACILWTTLSAEFHVSSGEELQRWNMQESKWTENRQTENTITRSLPTFCEKYEKKTRIILNLLLGRKFDNFIVKISETLILSVKKC
jgi:hypothetical protein